MKKAGIIMAGMLLLIIAGCNEKNLKKQLMGSWVVEKYLIEDRDSTVAFDTTYIDYTLTFAETNQVFTKTWKTKYVTYTAIYDTSYANDSLGNPYITNIDTNYSNVTKYNDHQTSGRWVLFNGNDYMQLRDSATAPAMDYRIKTHTANTLVLTRGNTEWQFKGK